MRPDFNIRVRRLITIACAYHRVYIRRGDRPRAARVRRHLHRLDVAIRRHGTA